MERIGGFKAQPLADCREAALIALSFKKLDGECREGLREYAPLLHIVKSGKLNSRQDTVDFSDQTTRRKVKVVGSQENQEVLPKSRWT